MLDPADATYMRCVQLRAHDAHVIEYYASRIPCESTLWEWSWRDSGPASQQLRIARKLSISGELRKQCLMPALFHDLNATILGIFSPYNLHSRFRSPLCPDRYQRDSRVSATEPSGLAHLICTETATLRCTGTETDI
jgi:hypothetical protein